MIQQQQKNSDKLSSIFFIYLAPSQMVDIDIDGYRFLESDSDAKMPTFSKQPPISPIESESSSGISSLDSDDLKVSSFFLFISSSLNIHLTHH